MLNFAALSHLHVCLQELIHQFQELTGPSICCLPATVRGACCTVCYVLTQLMLSTRVGWPATQDREAHLSLRVIPMQGPNDVLRSKCLSASSSDAVRLSAMARKFQYSHTHVTATHFRSKS